MAAFQRDFETRLKDVSTRWDLDVSTPWEASFALVAPVRRRKDNADCVLKLRTPGTEATAEVAALRAFDGNGAVRLLDADPDGGALLLQRARPGTDLRLLDDEEATRIMAGVAQRLGKQMTRENASGYPFPTLLQWADGFARSGLAAPEVEPAEALFRELCASSSEQRLLHGDLHHTNIVCHGSDWLAIDPHGVIGDPAFEVAAFVRNPYPAPTEPGAVEQRTARRLEILSRELEIPRSRLHAWSFAQTVLSACWVLEDGGDPTRELKLARRIQSAK